MNIFKKLFSKAAGSIPRSKQEAQRQEHLQQIKQNTDLLWQFLEETLVVYNEHSCQCAYPRFRQIVAIDCVDTGSSFYASETEGFIFKARKYFTTTPESSGPEAQNESWVCKKCGSVFQYGWADFSIHVNRTFLKPIDLKVGDTGSAAQLPIPLFVGIFGHKFPGKDQLIPVDFDTFKSYVRS